MMETYKKKVQKEVYDPAIKAAAKLGKDADYTVESPGVEKAGSYNVADVKKVLNQ